MKKFFFLFLILLPVVMHARISLPGLMSDGMVLQRNSSVSIWGYAAPSKSLRVSTEWNGATYRTSADSEGFWQVDIATAEAGGPYTIEISQGRDKELITDILIGEVWLCSGQSNMQMPLMGFNSQPVKGSVASILDAPSRRNVRLFQVPRHVRPGKQEDIDARWEHCSITSASTFSAVGFYFATRLADALGVPVGIIESDIGGTRIEAWMSRTSAVQVFPDVLATDHGDANDTGCLYDSMIWPLRRYSIRGFLWYQGESNVHGYKLYPELQASMVRDWRGIFPKGESLPFYFVMIAPYLYGDGYPYGSIAAPLFWEAQIKAWRLIPNSDIAVTTDIGSADDIHPSWKQEVADRLILLAMHGTYGDGGRDYEGSVADWRGPVYKSSVFHTDGTVTVEFDSASTLAPAKAFSDVPIQGFELAGEDRIFHKAEAHILQPTPYAFTRSVVVSCTEVPSPVAVRYAFHDVPECNLVNTLGLPAFPFRSDDW